MLYKGLDPKLLNAAALSVLAHVAHLAERGLVRFEGPFGEGSSCFPFVTIAPERVVRSAARRRARRRRPRLKFDQEAPDAGRVLPEIEGAVARGRAHVDARTCVRSFDADDDVVPETHDHGLLGDLDDPGLGRSQRGRLVDDGFPAQAPDGLLDEIEGLFTERSMTKVRKSG